MGSQVVVPPPGREAMMREFHQSHSGIVRMKGLARNYVWLPNMSADLEAKVHNCSVCQKHREAPATAPQHT